MPVMEDIFKYSWRSRPVTQLKNAFHRRCFSVNFETFCYRAYITEIPSQTACGQGIWFPNQQANNQKQASTGVLLNASSEILCEGHRKTSAMDYFAGTCCRYFPVKLSQYLNATTPKHPELKVHSKVRYISGNGKRLKNDV